MITIAVYSIAMNYINPPYSSLMFYRQLFYNYKNKEVKYISGKKIPAYVKRMVVAAEDYRFYQHNGIDIEAIKVAMKNNKAIGYNYYGGSTITQQLARTLFLIPKKYLIRKYFEAIIALEMDFFIPKERLLELYLNNVEWGKGIYGIESASFYYYKKSAIKLSYDEAARLITVLPSPLNYTPGTFYKRARMVYRYNFLLGLYN